MQWKPWLILGLSGLAAFLVFALTRAGTPQSEIAPCIANWDTLTWEEREHCAESIGGIALAEETVMAVAQQTADARPTQSLDSIRATEHAMWVEAGRPTPAPTPVPGIVPQGWEAVEPYQSDTKGLAPDPHWLKFTVNAWWLGATLDDDGSPRRIIIKSSSRTCGLGISYIKENGWPAGGEEHGFFCPEDINPIRIIGATGPTGVVTATDELSRTITFDLGTEEWTLEGQPWLPETTPTP
jgi:hypothetical protein